MADTEEVLKAIRKAKNLTQKEFAEKLNMKQSAYSMVESGTNKPSIELVKQIIKAFNVPADIFFADFDTITINDILINSGGEQESSLTLPELQNRRLLQVKEMYDDTRKKHSGINVYYTTDPIGIKSKRLQDLKESYTKRLKRELQHNHANLFEVMQLAENTDAAFELLKDISMNYINHPPDPFDASLYFDIKNNTEHIPDSIDYKVYKEDAFKWLTDIEKYKELISNFYEQTNAFLNGIKPLDDQGLI